MVATIQQMINYFCNTVHQRVDWLVLQSAVKIHSVQFPLALDFAMLNESF